MASTRPAPDGWSGTEDDLISARSFNSDGSFRLPKPYKPLLVRERDTFLIQCGETDSIDGDKIVDLSRFCFVIWNMITDSAMLITGPADINAIWRSLARYDIGPERPEEKLVYEIVEEHTPLSPLGSPPPWEKAEDEA